MLNRYRKIGDTDVQNADLQASEDNWMKPANPDKLTDADYRQMLAMSYGAQASLLARIDNLMALAEDRSQIIMVNSANFGADLPIPVGDMRSIILARPSLAEQTTGLAFAATIQITFDGMLSFQAPNPGITVVPIVAGTNTYKLTAASNPPAGWAMYLLFRNAQYSIGANL